MRRDGLSFSRLRRIDNMGRISCETRNCRREISLYSGFHPLVRHVFLCELRGPVWEVGSYSSGPPAKGIPQILL